MSYLMLHVHYTYAVLNGLEVAQKVGKNIVCLYRIE